MKKAMITWPAAEVGITLRYEGTGVAKDLKVAQRQALLRAHGHDVPMSVEN